MVGDSEVRKEDYIYTSEDIPSILGKYDGIAYQESKLETDSANLNDAVVIGAPINSISDANINKEIAEIKGLQQQVSTVEVPAKDQLKGNFKVNISLNINKVREIQLYNDQKIRLLYPYCSDSHWFVLCLDINSNSANIQLIDPYGHIAKLDENEKQQICNLNLQNRQ